MSRLKRFAHSLLSGYVLLGANMLYTLASVPLAWHYLSKDQFGLWTTTATIGGYIVLLDFGMGASVARILIDHKDDRASGKYGSVIQTGALVGIVQGLLILLVGTGMALVAGPLLRVPDELQHDFTWLMIGQCAILAFSLTGRMFQYLLTAHQRYDVANYTQTGLLGFGYLIMWYFFAHGAGVFSLLWAQLIGVALAVGINAMACLQLRLLPQRGEWGRPTRARFNELFRFGRDIFLFALGGQLINTSQTLLLTRFFGLEVAAVWSVYTRPYNMLLQTIYRVFDYSSAALAEMIVRGEQQLLTRRFQQIVVLSTGLSVGAGTLFALCNSAFVEVWLHPRAGWSPWNDLLLALWLVICVSVHAHTGLVGQTKQFVFLRFLFFFEGTAFVTMTILLHHFGGVTGMLLTSIACTLVFSLPYGLRRTREYFRLTWSDLVQWHHAPLVMTAWLVPVALATQWLTASFPPMQKLVVNAVCVGLWSAGLLVRYGLDESLRNEMWRRTPDWIRGVLARGSGAKP